MIASTMPLLTIHHKTEYRYAHPVAFGEHRIMLRPRDGHDLRVVSNILEIVPEPMSLRWIHDVFGNSVAKATFDERAETLSFVNIATVEHNPAEEFALTPDDPAYFYPFLYDDEEFPDLVQFITPQYGDPNGELSTWARNFLDAEGPTPTVIMLSIHPSRRADIIGTETIVAEPDVPIGFYRDGFGNICGRLLAPAGGVTLRGSALVGDSGLADVIVPTA